MAVETVVIILPAPKTFLAIWMVTAPVPLRPPGMNTVLPSRLSAPSSASALLMAWYAVTTYEGRAAASSKDSPGGFLVSSEPLMRAYSPLKKDGGPRKTGFSMDRP